MSVPYRTMIVAAMLLLNSVSQASADTASDREIFTRRFPNLTIDRFEPSPIPGLYQITSQHQILYASTSGHMLIGDLWSPEGENLSARSRDRLLITQVDSLSSSASITIGTGPLSVIEISDPDCPHCRILDRFLDQQEDLKRTIHYLPHTSIHPQALQKVAHTATSSAIFWIMSVLSLSAFRRISDNIASLFEPGSVVMAMAFGLFSFAMSRISLT